jgi:hypothetical protein
VEESRIDPGVRRYGLRCSIGPGNGARRRHDGRRPWPFADYALGGFPEFPQRSLPESTAAELQAELDEVIEEGTFTAAGSRSRTGKES